MLGRCILSSFPRRFPSDSTGFTFPPSGQLYFLGIAIALKSSSSVIRSPSSLTTLFSLMMPAPVDELFLSIAGFGPLDGVDAPPTFFWSRMFVVRSFFDRFFVLFLRSCEPVHPEDDARPRISKSVSVTPSQAPQPGG